MWQVCGSSPVVACSGLAGGCCVGEQGGVREPWPRCWSVSQAIRVSTAGAQGTGFWCQGQEQLWLREAEAVKRALPHGVPVLLMQLLATQVADQRAATMAAF